MEPQGVSDGSQVLRFPLQHERGGPERKKRKVREGEYSKERGRERERENERIETKIKQIRGIKRYENRTTNI
jgi:hypothetical protein